MMNILLPTDFSENSRNAAVYALQCFKDTPCVFHLLHVVPVSTAGMGIGFIGTPTETQQKFEQLLNWLDSIKKNPNHTFKPVFKVNYLIEAVRQQVLEKKIDLILMGTKGITNHENCIVGKNTSDVMMKVKCPVLAISEKAIFKGHKQILFPTDYKIHYGGKMLGTLNNLIPLPGASVKILEIFNSETEPSEEQIAGRNVLQNSFLPNVPVMQTFYTTKEENPGKYFPSAETDMIVMAAKNLNICQKLLNSRQSSEIPFIKQLPLLVLH